MPAKNSLLADDARAVEVAYQGALDVVDRQLGVSKPLEDAALSDAKAKQIQQSELPEMQLVRPIYKDIRRRNKAHLALVAAQHCLICKRSPCDAHHLKFAQPRSLGRKVSDQFTVPLCRDHHLQLHQHGNETAWWANLKIAPLELAKELWTTTLLQEGSSTPSASGIRPP